MRNDNEIYANGRTHAEHCAWLDSLTGDDYCTVYLPVGHLFNLAEASYLKRALLKTEMSADLRLKILQSIGECVFGPVTAEAVAAIEPCCNTGAAMLHEIHSLDVAKQTSAFQDGDVFRLLAQLNPSLLVALRLCMLNDRVPEQPRTRADA
jgi:hypothetical protein